MSQRAATIESLPMAFALVKEMQADGLEMGRGATARWAALRWPRSSRAG